MKRKTFKNLGFALALLSLFALWTALTCTQDVQPIGPSGTAVGFATINQFFHNLTGVHLGLYTLTDWLSLIPLLLVMGFGLFGLIQWIKRKNILNVDYSILVLGGFYFIIMALFLIFEEIALNYRPIFIDGKLEASYPSSTTMLILTVMPTAMMQFRSRIKDQRIGRLISFMIVVFTLFMVIGRLISGVHWLSDIIGGMLLSAGLVLLYVAVCDLK